jgi:hypothetical protein
VPDSLEATLDHCIDRLVAGEDWRDLVDERRPESTEVTHLMEVAHGLLLLASHATGLDRRGRDRVRRRIRTTHSMIRRILFYRIPCLPPLWLKPEAC